MLWCKFSFGMSIAGDGTALIMLRESITKSLQVFMAVVQTCDGVASWATYVDLGCNVIYTIEFFLKISAFGVVGDKHERGYFRRGLCWLDFVVVVSSWIEIAFSTGTNLSFMRVLRALRSLRSASKLKPGEEILLTVIRALPSLGRVFGLACFFYVFFGVIGLNVFGLDGHLHARCVSNDSLIAPDEFCFVLGANCGNGRSCVSNVAPSPHFGLLGFDNIGNSLLTVMVTGFQEGWSETMCGHKGKNCVSTDCV